MAHQPSASALPPPSRLLLPRVRSSDQITSYPRPSRPSRARSPLPLTPDHHHATALQWLGLPLNFDVVDTQLEIDGYQMYAVEKWIVERNRPITVLTVYTGDPSHKITVTALAPASSLPEKDAAAQWEQALLHLRRDASARPKQTSHGVLMATSLAYFRSDYTIVHIPHGNFLLAKDQLYANINLLRLGCGGRSALSLEEPSDTTKDRFISTYHIPEITLPSTHPIPLHHFHNSHLTSSDHLPLLPQPVSASPSLTSKDVHLGSPTRRPSHHRSRSHSSPRSSFSKSSAHPSIHIVGPTPTSSFRGGDSRQTTSTNSASSGPSTLALLTTHQKGKTKDLPSFNATVLELVKLVQVGLALFGMYDVKGGLSYTGGVLIDGLLCDVTVRGIERWIAEIGEPRVGLEPAERIADPVFVSALLSLILSICNKLNALSSNIFPKDPFLHPNAFTAALSSYVPSTTTLVCLSPNSPPSSTHVPPFVSTYVGGHNLPVSVTTAPFTATAFLNPGGAGSPTSPPSSSGLPSNTSSVNATQVHLPTIPVVLTKELIESIETAYAKRMASMNDSGGGDTLSISGGPVSGIMGIGSSTGAIGGGGSGSTTTLGLRDTAGGGGGGGGAGHSPSPGHTRRKVKRVLKGKLEDFTSAVTNDDGIGDDRGDGAGAGTGVVGGGLSGGEGDGNMSVGSTGGHLLRGVGNLLLSGASGIAGSAAGASGGTMNVWDVNIDLQGFVSSVVEKEGGRRVGARKKKGTKGSESVDFGRANLALALSNNHNTRSNTAFPPAMVGGNHGVIVSMLWSGRVADVVALREWEKERERLENIGGLGSPGGVASDGEEARSDGIAGKSTEGEDSDLQTEGRSVGSSFGGVWSEKMQRRLGNWAGLARKRGDVLPTTGSIARQGKGLNRFSLTPRSPNSKNVEGGGKERSQSPTPDPGPIPTDLERDEILLDSGQVSPSSEYRSNPFTLDNPSRISKGSQFQFYDNSRGVSTAELGRSGSSNADHGIQNLKNQSPNLLANLPPLGAPFEFDTEKAKSYSRLSVDQWHKPVQQQRIATWSDSRSAWAEEGIWMAGKQVKGRKRRKARSVKDKTTLEGTVEEGDGEGKEEEEEDDDGVLDQREVESDNDGWRKTKKPGLRRRSYHDLDSLRSAKVLSPEHMRIDVELCAQVLIMMRREEHLRNVVACLEALTSTLGDTNSLLQNDFEQHRDALLEIERRSKVISGIEGQLYDADQISQAKNMLQYESAQFLVSELWHTASLSRKKVFELREKVFGAGGRRLPPGKHGAHGQFNRMQWTFDGERRLVDYLGRTEDEVKEESRVNIAAMHPRPPEGEEADVVENPSIRPMWLLRFFASWGARWSALRVGGAQATTSTQGSDAAPAEGSEEITQKGL